MQYYVIGPDGNKYGPADVPTLKQWIAENRLTPQSMVEDFNSGQRMPASSVPGLFEAGQTATATPTPGPSMGAASPYSQVPTPGGPGYYNPQGSYDNGQSELTLAWVFSVIGVVLCGCGWIFGPLGIWKANEAAAKGNPNAQGPKILGIVATVIGVLLVVARIILIFVAIGSSAGRNPFNP